MKRILVTGAAGFIGSRFTESALARGYDVIAVDELRHFSDRPQLRRVPFTTIVDREELVAYLKREAPKLEAIVHLGARTDTAEKDPAVFQKLNIDYSKTLWAYASEKRVPFVYASSAATYGGGELGYRDDESTMSQLRPLNPYGLSKLAFDLWALAQDQAGRKPPSWSGWKFFNVYGFGEAHKGFMSSVVLHWFQEISRSGRAKLFRSHKPGIPDGHQARDFILVDDLIEVLWFALERPIKRGVFNLGTGKASTYLEFVRAVFRALGKPEQIDWVDTPEAVRDRYQYFTQAEMKRLHDEGFTRPFATASEGAEIYVRSLLNSQGT